MVTARKPSRSFANGNCVEVSERAGNIVVSDSKDPGHGIEFPPEAWRRFTLLVKGDGEERLTYMLVLDCKHVVPRGPMPPWIANLTCLPATGSTTWCDDCTADMERRAHDLRPYDPRTPRPVARTVVRAGLWDWAVWEQMRDERGREQHLKSLAHHMGRCSCEPEEEDRTVIADLTGGTAPRAMSATSSPPP